MDPQPFSRAFPFILSDVFHFADHQDEIAWEPYKKGVDIFRLYGDGITGPTAALVRYRERGEVPMHELPPSPSDRTLHHIAGHIRWI